MVTNHAKGFIAAEFPYRQHTTLLVLCQECFDPVEGTLTVNDGVQRMQGPVCIPQ